eukprot:scaffold1793_cov164-Ochromonas_danica.AAC.5
MKIEKEKEFSDYLRSTIDVDARVRSQVNYRMLIKDPVLRATYDNFNILHQSLSSLFVFNLSLTLFCIPIVFLATYQLFHSTTRWDSLNSIATIALFAGVDVASWIVYLQLNTISEHNNGRLPLESRIFLEKFQMIVYGTLNLVACYRIIARSVYGVCEASGHMMGVWNCNPFSIVGGIPIDSSMIAMLLPILYSVSVRGGRYARRQNYFLFFLHTELMDYVKRQEVAANEANAEEMRHMIANVAHDLKTPLSSFLNGLDYVAELLAEAQEKEHSDQVTPSFFHDFLVSVDSCLLNMKNTNTFMLMTINRCIDYTKANQGMKLKPKCETCDLYDALNLPLTCMQDVQQRLSITLAPIPREICSHIITDKQWLQENVLCLLSNAVKYSNEGDIDIHVYLVQHSLESLKLNGLIAVGGVVAHAPSAAVLSPPRTAANRRGLQLRDSPLRSIETLENCHHEGSHPVEMFSPISGMEEEDEEFLRFEVSDHGIGLSEDAMKGLFSPFKQAQRLAGGTGLGLFSLAKRIEALGGNCGVDNRRDGQQGSLFWFEIPYRPDFAAAHAQATDRVSLNRSSFISRKTCVGQKSSVSPPSIASMSSRSREHSEKVFHCSDSSRTIVFRRSESDQLLAADEGFLDKELERSASIVTTISPYLDSAAVLSCSLMTMQSSGIDLDEMPKKVSATSMKGSNDGHHNVDNSQGLKILLVDDSVSILKMTSMALKRHGHVVTTACNGAEALKILSERWTREQSGFDVVLMDLQMPIMDGLEATRRWREIEEEENFSLHGQQRNADREYLSLSSDSSNSLPLLPTVSLDLLRPHQLVIGVSANSDNDVASEAAAVGMDAFLTKPFAIDTFYKIYDQIHRQQSEWQD